MQRCRKKRPLNDPKDQPASRSDEELENEQGESHDLQQCFRSKAA